MFFLNVNFKKLFTNYVIKIKCALCNMKIKEKMKELKEKLASLLLTTSVYKKKKLMSIKVDGIKNLRVV